MAYFNQPKYEFGTAPVLAIPPRHRAHHNHWCRLKKHIKPLFLHGPCQRRVKHHGFGQLLAVAGPRWAHRVHSFWGPWGIVLNSPYFGAS